MSDDVKQGSDEPRFSAAMQELEAILGRIEDEQVDIDILAEELRRAATLLEICRARIRKAEVEVSQIVQDLHGEDEVAVQGDVEPEDEERPEGKLPFAD